MSVTAPPQFQILPPPQVTSSFRSLANACIPSKDYTTITTLASHRNRSAPPQDRTYPIPASERGRPLCHNRWISRRPTEPEQLVIPCPQPPTPVSYPTIIGDNLSTQPLPPTLHPLQHSWSEDNSLLSLLHRPFLLEAFYLAPTVPTRNKVELRAFKEHCLYLLQGRDKKYLEHPITNIFTYCPHPIVFVDFLWRYCITITWDGILEDYRHIWSHPNNSESIRLIRAYSVFYGWNNDSFTISLV